MGSVMLALLLLQVKHFLGDFVFQTQRQVQYKGVYGAWPGLEHSGLHAAMSVPCLLLAGAAPVAALVAALIEFVVHYHQDWARERFVRRTGLTPAARQYWVLLGADQLVHQLTYVAIVWVLW